jgi:hypothetical protein
MDIPGIKLIIAGGRDFGGLNFRHHNLLNQSLTKVKSPISEVVCGMATGADNAGRVWAQNRKIVVREFPAEWDRYGRSAGMIRNKQMAEYADALVAFWDGQSRGTKNMIETMQALGKPVWVVRY